MNVDIALSSDVLPELVPPATSTFCSAVTATRRKSRAGGVSDPSWISQSMSSIILLNLRMLMTVPRRAHGALATCTREPSGRRASTRISSIGQRLAGELQDVVDRRLVHLSVAERGVGQHQLPVALRRRSPSGALIMTSDTDVSARYGRIGAR